MIDENLPLGFGAKRAPYSIGDQLFKKGDTAINYYQDLHDDIEMNNYNFDRKEYIQGLFTKGQSIEEPLFYRGEISWKCRGQQ